MRKEHPRPQFVRKDWLNLNGVWTCEYSKNIKGFKKSKLNSKKFSKKINVPFCPESKLSGIGHTDFIQEMYYQKTFKIPETWKNKKILLHFGGVDYESTIYINKKKVGFKVTSDTNEIFIIDKWLTIVDGKSDDDYSKDAYDAAKAEITAWDNSFANVGKTFNPDTGKME